jgi:drug/metabolite transporter (DMT)-like permease
VKINELNNQPDNKTNNKPGGLIDLNKVGWQWVALLTMAFIWGSSFILMKKGLESYTYTQVAAFRIFLSFVFLSPFIIKHIKKLKLANLKSLLIVGYIGAVIPAFLFTKSQTQINSSLAGMLNSLTPLFTLLIGVIFYKSKFKIQNILGVLLGFLGALGLIFKGQAGIFDEINAYALFIVIATMCYGTQVNEIKHHLRELGGIAITALSFLLAGPVAGIYLLFSDYSQALASENYVINLGYIAILSLFSSAIALMIFNTLIKYTTALFAASVTYIIPVFAIMWGLMDGETILLTQLLWILVIFLGVYLVNRK